MNESRVRDGGTQQWCQNLSDEFDALVRSSGIAPASVFARISSLAIDLDDGTCTNSNGEDPGYAWGITRQHGQEKQPHHLRISNAGASLGRGLTRAAGVNYRTYSRLIQAIRKLDAGRGNSFPQAVGHEVTHVVVFDGNKTPSFTGMDLVNAYINQDEGAILRMASEIG